MKAYVALGMAAAMVSTVAQAQEEKKPELFKFGSQIRFDYDANTTETKDLNYYNEDGDVVKGKSEADGEGAKLDDVTEKQGIFNFTHLRLLFSGNLNEKASYMVRVDGKRLGTKAITVTCEEDEDQVHECEGETPVGLDGVVDGVERAYVDYKVMPMLKLRVGKDGTFLGGLEQETSAVDRYYQSMIFQTISAISPTVSGFGLEAKIAEGQTVALQIGNGRVDSGSRDHRHGDMSYNLLYKGDFGIVKPLVSYGIMKIVPPGIWDRVAVSSYSVGAMFDYMGVDGYVDYMTIANEQVSRKIADNKREEDSDPKGEILANAMSGSGMQVVVGYKVAMNEMAIRPFVKYNSDTLTNENKDEYATDEDSTDAQKANAWDDVVEATATQSAYALGVEFLPVGKNLRYHAAMLNNTVVTNDGQKYDKDITETSSSYVLGMALKI